MLNNIVQKTTEINPSLNEILDETREDIDVSSILTKVKERINSEQDKQTERYDKNKRPARVCNEGDLIKITNVSLKNEGRSRKLLPSCTWPFRVVEIFGQVRYKGFKLVVPLNVPQR